MTIPAPARNPFRTGPDMRFTKKPIRSAQAKIAMIPTRIAVSAARAAYWVKLVIARRPRNTPTINASDELGPTTAWRDEANIK